MHPNSASKEAVVLKLLEEGDTMLCLDARHEGVHVPPGHAQDPALRLILNLNFPRPIDITAEGISASLTFGGRRFACYISWDALWGAFNPQTMQGMTWPDSMPAEVRAEMEAQHAVPAPPPADPPTSQTSPPVSAEQAQSGKQREEPSTSRQRGHLRLVK